MILNEERTKLAKELQSVINRHSRENESNTADFILAEYMMKCLEAGEWLIKRRALWYGRYDCPANGGLQALKELKDEFAYVKDWTMPKKD